MIIFTRNIELATNNNYSYVIQRPVAGEVALVTGAASGLGESIAKIFASEGAYVAVSDLNQNSCHHVVKNLKNSNSHLAIKVDVTKKESLSNAVETLIKQFGKPPDIVVNSAGIINKTPDKNMAPVPLLKMEEQIFDEIVTARRVGDY